MKVFLGGTCNESIWRDELIPMLDIECAHYKYQLDRNGDLDICFCNHPENTDKHEGNCTKCLCPLWKGDEDDG